MKGPQNTLPKFLTISDVHLNSNVDMVDYGCDTGNDLWTRAQQKLDDLIVSEKPDFVLYLGDLPVHSGEQAPCTNGDKYIHKGIESVLEGLRTIANNRDVPLLYLPGNNDAYGGDYHSFTDSVGTVAESPYIMDAAGTKEWPMINSGKQAKFIDGNREFGYFSAYPLGTPKRNQKGLRTIMLNTVVFCCPAGMWTGYVDDDGVDQQDAGNEQLNWLEVQLEAAASADEAIIVAMHIPPGKGYYDGGPNWNQAQLYYDAQTKIHESFDEKFNALVKAYQKNIVGILTSHTHTDAIKRIIDGTDVIELTVSTPGVTVNHDNNPAMKIFNYSPSNYELMDFTTYYTTPTATGWGDKQYTFSDSFGCTNGESMLACVQRLTNNDPTGTQQNVVSLINKILYTKSPKGGVFRMPEALDIYVK